MKKIVDIKNLRKVFCKGNICVANDINLFINEGEIFTILGKSGSGKTTFLRMIAGLDTPDQGSIWLNGKNTAFMSVQEREIGFVSQAYALFPHMTVYENIAFGLHVKKESLPQIDERCRYLLNLIELNNLASHYPGQLSGGQRQRVALARALAPNPKVLLLDEPFAALDMRMRKELRDWIRRLRQRSSVTIVLVTHDYKEALEIATTIVMLKNGRVEQLGEPSDFYNYFISNKLL